MPWSNGRETHVPQKLRDACLARDEYRCTATLQVGGRCEETTQLEAHHVTQWQSDERITLDDLTTLCHWHHNRETQKQAAAARVKAKGQRPAAVHPRETHPALR